MSKPVNSPLFSKVYQGEEVTLFRELHQFCGCQSRFLLDVSGRDFINSFINRPAIQSKTVIQPETPNLKPLALCVRIFILLICLFIYCFCLHPYITTYGNNNDNKIIYFKINDFYLQISIEIFCEVQSSTHDRFQVS